MNASFPNKAAKPRRDGDSALTRQHARLCLGFNLILPGVGSLFARRPRTGAVQTLLTVVGFALLGYAFVEVFAFFKTYTQSMEQEPMESANALSGLFSTLWARMKQPLLIGVVGFVILKISWLWAQVTTAMAFRQVKRNEEHSRAA